MTVVYGIQTIVIRQIIYCLSINFIEKLLTNNNFSVKIFSTKICWGVYYGNKRKILKTAKICYIVSKILHILSCVACTVFIVLAVALSCTHAVKTLTVGETAVLFSTLALYSFMCIGLLWNVEGIFKSIGEAQAPFGERVSHYLQKIAVFVILLAVIPALVGSILVRIICPETELVFPVSFAGIIAGVVMFIFGMFFKYGKELQKNDDETL